MELALAQGEDFPVKPRQLNLADKREEMKTKGDQDSSGDQNREQGDLEAEHLVIPYAGSFRR